MWRRVTPQVAVIPYTTLTPLQDVHKWGKTQEGSMPRPPSIKQVPQEPWLHGLINVISLQGGLPLPSSGIPVRKHHCHFPVPSARHAKWVAGLSTQVLVDLVLWCQGWSPGPLTHEANRITELQACPS